MLCPSGYFTYLYNCTKLNASLLCPVLLGEYDGWQRKKSNVGSIFMVLLYNPVAGEKKNLNKKIDKKVRKVHTGNRTPDHSHPKRVSYP